MVERKVNLWHGSDDRLTGDGDTTEKVTVFWYTPGHATNLKGMDRDIIRPLVPPTRRKNRTEDEESEESDLRDDALPSEPLGLSLHGKQPRRAAARKSAQATK